LRRYPPDRPSFFGRRQSLSADCYRELERILDRLQAVEDKIEILGGASLRTDGTGLEVSGMLRLLIRLDRRVRRLEDGSDRL
jgi:hypothetical protein